MASRLRITPFSLRDTMECGQFFRFTRVDATYVVQTGGRIFALWQRGADLFFDGIEEEFLIRFLRLDEDLDGILKEVDRDPVLHSAIETYRGLRLIRQDPWECLISYLCSSAKGIPHIRSIIENLCKSSGRKVRYGNYVGYEFPGPLCLTSSRDWDSVGAGFRTGYLVKAGQCIDRERLIQLKSLPYREAKEALTELPGVGKKVADCVLLYGLDFLEAFPLDTWTRKGLQKAYFHGRRVGPKKMEEFVSRHFGRFAGVAQLYLYHYWRNRSKEQKYGKGKGHDAG
jgi:N-glycosylase/DNA lyase